MEHCLTTSRGKTHEKNFRGPKLGPKLGFLPFSQGCIIIAQDCSLKQCLITSRAETSLKKLCDPNLSRNDPLFSNVIERPLKLACFSLYLSVLFVVVVVVVVVFSFYFFLFLFLLCFLFQ